jgi:hypothetical protein
MKMKVILAAPCGLQTLAATAAVDDGSVLPFPPSQDECGRMSLRAPVSSFIIHTSAFNSRCRI